MPRHPIAIALTVLAAACTPSIPVLEKDVEAARMQSEALAMRQATEKAQATLGDFLVKAKELPAGTKDYAVKVGVRKAAPPSTSGSTNSAGRMASSWAGSTMSHAW